MSLNIKDRETHDLAAALAKRKGQSMTRVIRDALRSELERSDREVAVASLAADLLKIGKECAEALGPEGRTIVLEDLLYDENGMPK
jgi:hypothetical protein